MDISPVFGMSLMVLIGTDTVVALVASGMVAVAIYIANWRLLKQQKKMDSAKLSAEKFEPWKKVKDPEFAAFADKMQAGKVDKGDHPMIRRFLDALEEVAILWNDDMITDKHVKEFFGPELRAIFRNPPAHELLKENHKKCAYDNLCELLEKVKKWYGLSAAPACSLTK